LKASGDFGVDRPDPRVVFELSIRCFRVSKGAGSAFVGTWDSAFTFGIAHDNESKKGSALALAVSFEKRRRPIVTTDLTNPSGIARITRKADFFNFAEWAPFPRLFTQAAEIVGRNRADREAVKEQPGVESRGWRDDTPGSRWTE
jgi:hypothetical protein